MVSGNDNSTGLKTASTVKVVHISTYINGGAGSAAYRLHKALLKNEVHSSFLCAVPVTDDDKTAYQVQGPKPSLLKRALAKAGKIWFANRLPEMGEQKKIEQQFAALYSRLQCGFASLPFSGYNILNHPAVLQADIIHLHWVAGLLDYPSFFKKNTKPFVWTMHDMNPIKGIYHYEGDEKRNESLSAALNEQVAQLKKAGIQKRNCSLFYVTPSEWLKDEVAISDAFRGLPGAAIPNPVDTNAFKPRETATLKKQLHIPEGNTVLLFVAEAVEDYRKGFDVLMDALHALTDFPLTLLVIGNHSKPVVVNADIRLLGSTADTAILSGYYSLADAFIIPSREDNLPNVMVEAMACGTPVLSFNVGGMATVIQDNINGIKASTITADGLASVIKTFIQHKTAFHADIVREFAVNHFSENVVAKQYRQVYAAVLKN